MPKVSVTINKKPFAESKQNSEADAHTNDEAAVQNNEDTAQLLAAHSQILSKQALLDAYRVPALPVQKLNNGNTDQKTEEQRQTLYANQTERTRQLYLASAATRPTYLVQTLKPQFDEYRHFLMSVELDKRGIVNAEALTVLWQQLHVVDDIIEDIIKRMPAQKPAGWQITTQGRNYLKLPTVGRLRQDDPVADQGSLNSYVLGHFGVMSYTYDRSYFIGHVLGYLFCCYFCAHLSINYGVMPLANNVVKNFEYASLPTAKMVRLLQALDGYCKKRIYQLAVICARLSYYATDKRIEKMLIAEVNDFDKKKQQHDIDLLLANGMMPASLADERNFDE